MQEALKWLKTDAQAIGEAIKAGVTRDKTQGQGNGLAGSLQVATLSDGSFEIMSGTHAMTIFKNSTQNASVVNFSGTFVDFQLNLSNPIDLSVALRFNDQYYAPLDYIESNYEDDKRNGLILHLSKETVGFGSREAGKQLRTKCINLLNLSPNHPMYLDWTGVPVISSSFADELMGKLFAKLGPLTFSSRVRNLGLDQLTQALIDNAIMQRASQSGSVTFSPD